MARRLLLHFQNDLSGFGFRSAETCYLLGNIYEDMAATKKAPAGEDYIDKARKVSFFLSTNNLYDHLYFTQKRKTTTVNILGSQKTKPELENVHSSSRFF